MLWIIMVIFATVVLILAKMLQIIGEYIEESMDEIGGIDGIDEEEIM